MTAQGQINIGTIVNPTIARPVSANGGVNDHWDLEYALTSSVSLTSVTGDVSLYGNPSLYYGPGASGGSGSLSILPPTVTITADLDIDLFTNFTLAPWQYGNLTLLAGRNIDGLLANGLRASIYLPERPDAPPGSPATRFTDLKRIRMATLNTRLPVTPAGMLRGSFTPATRTPQL